MDKKKIGKKILNRTWGRSAGSGHRWDEKCLLLIYVKCPTSVKRFSFTLSQVAVCDWWSILIKKGSLNITWRLLIWYWRPLGTQRNAVHYSLLFISHYLVCVCVELLGRKYLVCSCMQAIKPTSLLCPLWTIKWKCGKWYKLKGRFLGRGNPADRGRPGKISKIWWVKEREWEEDKRYKGRER